MSTLIFEYRIRWDKSYNLPNVQQQLCAAYESQHAAVNHIDNHSCTTITCEREVGHGPPRAVIRGYKD